MIDFGDSLPKLWLKRAQNVPLDLKLTWYPVINAANSQHHKDVVDYFVSTSPRWKKLHFLLTDGPDHNSLWFHIQKLFSVPMPALETFKIDAHHLPATRAPNLLNFQDFRAELNPSVYSLPWSQLTHFKYLHCKGAYGTIRLIKNCPNLEVLDVCVESYRTSRAIDPPVRFSRLWSLTIRNTGGENVDPFIDSLELPSLSELAIITAEYLQHEDVPWTLQGIQSLVMRSGPDCELKVLQVKGYDCGSEVMIEVFSSIKSLKTFDVCP